MKSVILLLLSFICGTAAIWMHNIKFSPALTGLMLMATSILFGFSVAKILSKKDPKKV